MLVNPIARCLFEGQGILGIANLLGQLNSHSVGRNNNFNEHEIHQHAQFCQNLPLELAEAAEALPFWEYLQEMRYFAHEYEQTNK
jgi:hypothetical protein